MLVRMPPCHPHSIVGTGSSPPILSGPQKALTCSELLCFMAYYVYVIQSQLEILIIKAFLRSHSYGLISTITKNVIIPPAKLPWKLVFVEEFESKTTALIREKNLKKASKERIMALLNHSKNIVAQFIDVG